MAISRNQIEDLAKIIGDNFPAVFSFYRGRHGFETAISKSYDLVNELNKACNDLQATSRLLKNLGGRKPSQGKPVMIEDLRRSLFRVQASLEELVEQEEHPDDPALLHAIEAAQDFATSATSYRYMLILAKREAELRKAG